MQSGRNGLIVQFGCVQVTELHAFQAFLSFHDHKSRLKELPQATSSSKPRSQSNFMCSMEAVVLAFSMHHSISPSYMLNIVALANLLLF